MSVRVLLVALSVALSGCIVSPRDESAEPSAVETPSLPLPVFDSGRLQMPVDVPVVLVGFPPEAAAALRQSLDTEDVDHAVGDFNQMLPPDPEEGLEGNAPLLGESFDLPIHPMARYKLRVADAQFETEVAALLPSLARGTGKVLVLDGNAFEAFLAERLVSAGLVLDPDAPSIVLVHLDSFDVPAHGWRYDFHHGFLQTVQAFGEQHPFIVVDPSATVWRAPEPFFQAYDNATGREPGPSSRPLSTSPEDLDEIAFLVREATHYRMLASAIYPVALTDCHAITLVYAYRPTNLSPVLGLPDGEDLLDAEELRRGWANLTGGTVHVDVKVLLLPVDDPVLDALARGEFATLELQRFWLSQNWENYWVAHDGCEPYVSFLVHGDVASASTGIIGIGTYDASKSYRISISWVNEALRHAFDPASPAGILSDSTHTYNWVQFLFAHEVGHTIGMHHPFHSGRKSGSFTNTYFQDVWSAMSYSTDGRIIDFGAIDQNNFRRNRAAFLFAAAEHAGLAGSAPWEAAIGYAAAYDWSAASEALWPAVAGAAGSHEHVAPWLGGGLRVAPTPSVSHGFGPPDADPDHKP